MYGRLLGGRGATRDALIDAIDAIRGFACRARVGDCDPSRAADVHRRPFGLLPAQPLVQRFPVPLAGGSDRVVLKAVRPIRWDVAGVQRVGSRWSHQRLAGVVLDRVPEISSLGLLLVVLLRHRIAPLRRADLASRKNLPGPAQPPNIRRAGQRVARRAPRTTSSLHRAAARPVSTL